MHPTLPSHRACGCHSSTTWFSIQSVAPFTETQWVWQRCGLTKSVERTGMSRSRLLCLSDASGGSSPSLTSVVICHATKPTGEEKYMIKTEGIAIPPVCRDTGREVFREDINRAVRILKEAGCSERFLFWTRGTLYRILNDMNLLPQTSGAASRSFYDIKFIKS